MMMDIRINQVSAISVLRYGYLAFTAIMLPFSLLFGVIGLMGGRGVFINGQPVFGLTALVSSLLMGVVFPLFPALALTLGTLVLRLLGERAPLFRFRRD